MENKELLEMVRSKAQSWLTKRPSLIGAKSTPFMSSAPRTICSASVSYTHLDVYKRQRLGIMDKCYLICRNTILDKCFLQIIIDGKVLILSLIHI